MNADKHDNMQRIAKLTLQEWKDTVSIHQAYLWWNDLKSLIDRAHFQIDKANINFGEGDLPERISWLRERMEDAEDKIRDFCSKE